VTMNVMDFRRTPMPMVYAAVERLAGEQGTSLVEGELIGLIPQAAYDPDALWIRSIPAFDPEQKILERRLDSPLPWPEA
jgi:glutamate formiminotransferase